MGLEGDSVASGGAEAKVICGAKTDTEKLAFQVGWQEELRPPRGVTGYFDVLRDRVAAKKPKFVERFAHSIRFTGSGCALQPP